MKAPTSTIHLYQTTTSTPEQIISGLRDAIVPPGNAKYLHERLPHSELHLIDSGHFVWEDTADEYATLVKAWWSGNYKTVVKRSTEPTPN